MPDREIPREVQTRELTALEGETITRAVFVPSDPRPSELMLIFGAPRSSGNWRAAANLLRSGFAQRVLVTGGMPYEPSQTVTEAQGIRLALVELGVAPDLIMVEAQSRNTLENVVFSRRLLESLGAIPGSIVYYCKAHHAGRVWRTLCKHLPGIAFSAATYDAVYGNLTISARNWFESHAARPRVLAEYDRILRYSARGDIA